VRKGRVGVRDKNLTKYVIICIWLCVAECQKIRELTREGEGGSGGEYRVQHRVVWYVQNLPACVLRIVLYIG
jgi:hypothetical protein